MSEFIKAIPASSLNGSGLLLAPEFRDAVVAELGTHKYTLQNGAGQQFPCSITRKVQGGHVRCDIHGGWKVFARGNSIEAGDEVRIRHLGGSLIEVTKTGNKGTPGRTPAKAPRAARTPRAAKKEGAAAAKTPVSSGGVAKRRRSSSAAKAAAAAGTPASPVSGRRPRRSSTGTPAAAAPPAEQKEPQQGGSWCAIM